MAKFYYQGHGSYRITTTDGRVIYFDPFAGDGYDQPASLILVTHQHEDHNHIELCAQKPGCRIITNEQALAGGTHQNFNLGWIKIESTYAANKNHDPKECVGYILALDGVQLYCAGDTSKYPGMKDLARRKLDYAILPGDGIYNMDLPEAAECAQMIGAKHNIPVHVKPGELFDLERAEGWTAPNKLIVQPGEEIEL
jgi:L-ascorbate metabolism protein UlaG (beta-lactamase superfamily)